MMVLIAAIVCDLRHAKPRIFRGGTEDDRQGKREFRSRVGLSLTRNEHRGSSQRAGHDFRKEPTASCSRYPETHAGRIRLNFSHVAPPRTLLLPAGAAS